jgi:hypothetical protein
MLNGNFKYLSKLYIVTLITIISLSLSGRLDNSKFYFCGGKIYDPDYQLSTGNINAICQRIGNNENRILISIQRNIALPTRTSLSTQDENNLYTRDTEDIFLAQCARVGSYTCDWGYLFSLYTERSMDGSRKARLTAGRLSKNNLSTSYRENIMNVARSNLQNNQFTDGIIKVVDQFHVILGNNNIRGGSSITTYNQPQTTYTTHTTNNNSGGGFWKFLLFLLFVGICVGCCYCAYKTYNVENAGLNHHHSVVHYTSENVRHHLHKLEHLLKDVRNSNPPLVSINKCLLCMDTIQGFNNQNNNFYEMNNFSTTNNDMRTNLIQQQTNNLTRFQCGHLYHTACLDSFGLGCCLMCEPDLNARIKIINLSNEHIVDEIQIRKFICNFNRIYGKEVVEEYTHRYPEDYTATMAVVGLTSFAAGALVASAMMDHHSYGGPVINQYNTYNNYDGGNYNPGYGGINSNNNYNYHNNNNNNYGNYDTGYAGDVAGGVTGADLDTAELDY